MSRSAGQGQTYFQHHDHPVILYVSSAYILVAVVICDFVANVVVVVATCFLGIASLCAFVYKQKMKK